MQEFVMRVSEALLKPWNKRLCTYLRRNGTQEFLGDLRGVSQSTMSRIVAKLVPVVRSVLKEFVPTAEEAIDLVEGRACLVDGTITPCWSYPGHQELWSRKHGTTGFNAQVVCLLDGEPVCIYDALPGCAHDAKAFATTSVAEIIRNSGGGIGDKNCRGCGLVTPRKTPPGGELSKGDKESNAAISGLREPPRGLSHTSRRGGYPTPATAARTVPIVRRTMPPEACFSSQNTRGFE
jgi:hypothetical protein